jgi:hypothetical protein
MMATGHPEVTRALERFQRCFRDSNQSKPMNEDFYVRLSELASIRGPLRLPVERDLHFNPTHPLSWYTEKAQSCGYVMA